VFRLPTRFAARVGAARWQRKPLSHYEMAVLSELFLGTRGRIRAYAFELATAVVWAVSGISYLISPQITALQSPVGHTIRGYETGWSILYIVGAILVVYGALRPAMPVRAAGLLLLGTGLTMQLLGAVSVQVQLRDLNYLIFALACFARAALIWKLANKVGWWAGRKR
jgi:hypothetical protein